MVENAIFGKNVDKDVFGSDLAKLKQRTIKSRKLSKEEIDFHLLMALAFHDFPRKKNPLSSLLGVVVKNAWIRLSMINFK